MYCYIWTPYISHEHPNTINFVLTELEEGSIFRGSKSFFNVILADLGIEAEVSNWSIKPYRSNYYTDFLGDSDWRDIWQIVWKTRLITLETINTIFEFEDQYIETEAFDETASVDNIIPDDAVIGCLVNSDFENKTDLLRAQLEITNTDFSQMKEKYSVGTPVFSYSSYGEYQQLQIDLGQFPGDFFEQGADYASQILNLCQNAGGTVHFQSRY